MCAYVRMLYVAVIDTGKHHFNFWSGLSKRFQKQYRLLLLSLFASPKLLLEIPSTLDTGLGAVDLELT